LNDLHCRAFRKSKEGKIGIRPIVALLCIKRRYPSLNELRFGYTNDNLFVSPSGAHERRDNL